MLSFFSTRSLKVKLLGTIAAAFILLLLLLVMHLTQQLHNMKDDLVTQTRHTMEQEVLGRLQSEAANLGNEMAGYINGLFRVSSSLAQALSWSTGAGAQQLSRDQVNALARANLAHHTDISAIYAQFESNAYDGRDSEFTDSEALHSVPGHGGLEIYWVRNSTGQLIQEQIDDPEEKYLADKNEFGQRESEWFLCARDTKKPCTMEPYFYEITEGYSELMTSIISPVMAGNEFRGIVGIDINLPVLQKLIENLGRELYQGKSRITLLSEIGLIVGSNTYKDQLTRPLKEARDTFDGQLTALHNKTDRTWFYGDTYYVAFPVKLPASNTTWSLLIELPEEVVLASTSALTKTMDENIASMLQSEIIIALIATLVVLGLLLVLVRSIVQPIKHLNERVHNLASQNGDLSKTLDIHTHAELISLSQGFNLFITKLRNMVIEIKQLGREASTSANDIKTINAQSVNSTHQQQREIDSVVTATNEMSQTASGVSQLAAQVSGNATRALGTVTESREALAGSVTQVRQLSEDMQEASDRISEVATRTEDINRILDVIRNLADQTNLLALNAAIEAARAGEQGRGFAVVADEVRSLASKTQNSTDEINETINSLKDGVAKAVAVIAKSTEKADSAMGNTQASFESLSSVVEDVNAIADNIAQVATAAEEQSAVSEEISRNLTIIGDAANQLATMAGQSDQAGLALERVIGRLDEQLASLKT